MTYELTVERAEATGSIDTELEPGEQLEANFEYDAASESTETTVVR